MALTGPRNTAWLGRNKPLIPVPVAANTTLHTGGLACKNKAGYAVPAQAYGADPLDELVSLGIVTGTYLGYPGQEPANVSGQLIPGTQLAAGAAGAISAEIWEGTALLDISGTIDKTSIGKLCYVVDDHTVTMTSGSPVAGKVKGLESGQVWVDLTDKGSFSATS